MPNDAPILHPPKLPTQKNHLTDWLSYLVRWGMSERVTIVGDGWRVNRTSDGKTYIAPGTTKSTGSGGYKGEYDETKSYSAGDWVAVARGGTVIAGITLVNGFYVVDPAGTDKAGKTWLGSAAANPTTANNLAVPQPNPVLGAAPNDKYVWRPITLACNSLV